MLGIIDEWNAAGPLDDEDTSIGAQLQRVIDPYTGDCLSISLSERIFSLIAGVLSPSAAPQRRRRVRAGDCVMRCLKFGYSSSSAQQACLSHPIKEGCVLCTVWLTRVALPLVMAPHAARLSPGGRGRGRQAHRPRARAIRADHLPGCRLRDQRPLPELHPV